MQSIYKRSIIGIIFLLLNMNFSFAQSTTPDVVAEAENGLLAVGLTTGFFKLDIRYSSENKTQDLFVNGKGPSAVYMYPNTSTFSNVEAGKYFLNAGNTFAIQSNWGANIDKFSQYAIVKNVYNTTPNLGYPNANADAKMLYAFLQV